MVHHVHAGEQGRAARAAGHTLSIVVAKQHTIGGERIEVRCFEHRMSEGRKALPAPLISSDEQYVYRFSHNALVSVLINAPCSSAPLRVNSPAR